MNTENNTKMQEIAQAFVNNDAEFMKSRIGLIVNHLTPTPLVAQFYAKDLGDATGMHAVTAGKQARQLVAFGVLTSGEDGTGRTFYRLHPNFRETYKRLKGLDARRDTLVMKPGEDTDWRDADYVRRTAPETAPIILEGVEMNINELMDFYAMVSRLLYYTPRKTSFVSVSYKIKGKDFTVSELNVALDRIEALNYRQDLKDLVNSVRKELNLPQIVFS